MGTGTFGLDPPEWRTPGKFSLACERRDDGGLRITSPEVPGLVLSHADPQKVLREVMAAIDLLTSVNSAER